MKLEFSRQILKSIQISNFMKIRPMGTELFHADGRTDMTLIDAFRNFANAHNNSVWRAGNPTDIRTRYLEEEFTVLPLLEPCRPERQ